ncbi:2-succinyl-5-enolpyruvyl-6-hydroxy-3-cyclohexene-1-carboxylic-acid synthase [Nocardioides sp. SYSU D00038]|uniref:2-succinyl-5-enolpyruvyl-6-hydroxy-3- cyclohexene-1-carboxylic-acid synthase n=1 Tax=Nocardioides sp. SYSU D00038 TaxID=2812554 RepID=UPI001968814F|nr:2-succinyl-5-enolpyruvyl-6-hydroxy-3-cyclohexene-1-carboxylic-acid synthase [Nocardioides sp. SYSU D00038]
MTSSAAELARSVVDQLVAAGVTEVVVCPGSRNAPLSFAVHDAAVAGRVRLHTRIDERSAGFLAVGLTRTGARSAVVCTSGTAVANLHPAALEAAHAGLPLVLVTADRPARLRGTGANQTTDQAAAFGPLVPAADLDAPAELATLLAHPGAVQLNVQLDEPLIAPGWSPAAGPLAAPAQRSDGPRPRATEPAPVPLGPRTVVVAGDDAGPPARLLAQAAGWPLLAEPSSGARTGDHALRTYRLLLEGPLGRSVERVVVHGHPTLSRPVSRLLARRDVEVLAAPARGAWAGRPFPVTGTIVGGDPHPDQATDDPDWLASWQRADRELGLAVDRLLAEEPALTPYAVAGAVARALPSGGLLVVGASSPVRDLDLAARPWPVGERRKVVANRGLAGIDGTVSTALGAALGRPHGTRNLALMGDVTFLHDSNGLVLGPDEPRPDLTLVVVNDDGGSIFSMLEQGAPAYASAFERLFGTPHGVDLEALCAATRTPHLRVDSAAALEQALASPNGGVEVVEAVVDRTGRRDLDERLRALAPR